MCRLLLSMPSLAQIRRLGVFTLLGGLSACFMIRLLCIPLASSSYCISTSLMIRNLFTDFTLWNRESSPPQSTCVSEKNCLNSTTSAAIIGMHLQHAHFMVDLIEGSGLPPGVFFDADGSVYFNASSFGLFSPINHAGFEDSKAKFLTDLQTLCKFRDSIGQYANFLSDTFLEYFSPVSVSPVLGPFEAVIERLEIATEREHSKRYPQNSIPDYQVIEVDRILSPSIDQFLANLSVTYGDLAADTQPIIGYFTDVHVYGESVAKELDTQILRADEAYRSIPWWEYHPVLNLFVEGALNVKPRRESATAYFDFLSKNEHDIRNLIEHAAIFYDHLIIFRRCAQWYSKCSAMTRQAASSELSDVSTTMELSSSLEYLRQRLESIFAWDIRYTPPRRVTERPPIDSDCTTEFLVEGDSGS
ncbi:hypothetical protein F5146DRAFT_1049720 [Armillaria mellea]|nr:hypothetical protein F5146DRAFT_1049720 [Armillaria mellea]